MPHDDHARTDLPSALAYRTNDELQWVARVFTSKPPTNKRGLVDFLVDQTRPPHLQRTLELAGETGRAVLARAAHGNGLLRTARLAVPAFELGSWQRDRSGRRFIQMMWSSKRTPSARYQPEVSPSVVLLFFPDDLSMPPALRTRLARLLPTPSWPRLEPCRGTPPGVCVEGDAEADLSLVLESAKAGHLLVTKTGPSATSLRRLAGGLSCASPHADYDILRLRCLTTLLTAAGWLRRTAVRLDAGHPEPDRRALQSLVTAYRTWTHDEMHDLTGLRGTRDDDEPISEPVARRDALLHVLGRCPVGAWMDVNSFLGHASATAAIDPLLDDACEISIGRDYGGSISALGDAGLAAVRHAWCRLVLGCYLAPLGIIEVSLGQMAALPEFERYDYDDDDIPDHISAADRVAAIRLTPVGAWLLGHGPIPAAPTAQAGGWRVQSDGSVVSLGERVAPAERVLLDRIAERIDERSWRLERSRLMTAFAAGDSPETLRARLTVLSDGTLPDMINRLLDDACRRATAVVVDDQLIMLRVDDPVAREQLLFDRSTRALCRDCGGTLVGVPPSGLASVRRAARKLGWHIPEQRPDRHAR